MNEQPATVLLSGASGLVGSALIPELKKRGFLLRTLTRNKACVDSSTFYWNIEHQELDLAAFDGVQAVIHLAGENVASGRWTQAKKSSIRESRVHSTRLLVNAFQKLPNPPGIFVSASAVGIYGDRGSELLDESSSLGQGYLADVAKEWESEATKATSLGIRVVLPRIGVVLSPEGGALRKMLPAFRLGLGGKLGSGAQFMSWIALPDLVRIIIYALENSNLSGPVNATAPQAIQNHEFTKTLGRVLRRPTVFPVPTLILRLLLGEMADALLLSSTRVVPSCLQEAQFQFEYADLESALRKLLRPAISVE